MLDRLFRAHPRSVGESYLKHQRVAFSYAATLLGASIACAIHALVPGIFVTTGSRVVARLNERMVANRRRPAVAARRVDSSSMPT